MASDRELLFKGFSEVERQAFLALGKQERHPIRALLLKEGELGSDMLLIEEGLLSIWARDVKVSEVGPDSILGITALVEPHERTASLVAETEVEARRFMRSAVLAHLEALPERLAHLFYINAFRIHMNLIRRCEERLIQLSRELPAR